MTAARAARSRKTAPSSNGRPKLTAFNKFMQTELARLEEARPELEHQERFKSASENWKVEEVVPLTATPQPDR
ncbi:hypothetical protein [Streptomyces sp. NPDC050507]|uniref:hypothetical protein n=1 Tax=unclassified Streptomyces TaxID=2593676 RepID=UPI003252F0A6